VRAVAEPLSRLGLPALSRPAPLVAPFSRRIDTGGVPARSPGRGNQRAVTRAENRWFSGQPRGVTVVAGTAEAPRETPRGSPALAEGFPRIAFSLQESSLGAMFSGWWVRRGASAFSSPAQSSKPSQRHGRTRVELKFTGRSGRHASVFFFPQGFCDESRQDSGCLWLR